MEHFVIIVTASSFQPLTIITKYSILDVAAVLDPPLNILSSFADFLVAFNKNGNEDLFPKARAKNQRQELGLKARPVFRFQNLESRPGSRPRMKILRYSTPDLVY